MKKETSQPTNLLLKLNPSMVTVVFFHKMFLHLVNRTPDHGKRKHTFYDIIVNMFY